MCELKEDSKVSVTKVGYIGRVGVIDTIYNDEIYIVRLDDGELIKCIREDLFLMAETDSAPETITISRENFVKTVLKVIDPKNFNMGDPTTQLAVSLTGILIGKRLEKELFGDKND